MEILHLQTQARFLQTHGEFGDSPNSGPFSPRGELGDSPNSGPFSRPVRFLQNRARPCFLETRAAFADFSAAFGDSPSSGPFLQTRPELEMIRQTQSPKSARARVLQARLALRAKTRFANVLVATIRFSMEIEWVNVWSI